MWKKKLKVKTVPSKKDSNDVMKNEKGKLCEAKPRL